MNGVEIHGWVQHTSRDSSRREACSVFSRFTSSRRSLTTWTLSPRMVALSFFGRSGSDSIIKLQAFTYCHYSSSLKMRLASLPRALARSENCSFNLSLRSFSRSALCSLRADRRSSFTEPPGIGLFHTQWNEKTLLARKPQIILQKHLWVQKTFQTGTLLDAARNQTYMVGERFKWLHSKINSQFRVTVLSQNA